MNQAAEPTERGVTADEEAFAVRVIQNLSSFMHYSEIGIASKTSPVTARIVLLTGRLPKREHARRALVAFARANAEASERRQIRFV